MVTASLLCCYPPCVHTRALLRRIQVTRTEVSGLGFVDPRVT